MPLKRATVGKSFQYGVEAMQAACGDRRWIAAISTGAGTGKWSSRRETGLPDRNRGKKNRQSWEIGGAARR
jgi:hypothetical protein